MQIHSTFTQALDVSRPHTLLTIDVVRSGSLTYRYDDTQERVTVPNIWYNQTFQSRVAAIRMDAKRRDESSDRYQRNPTVGLSADSVDRIVQQLRHRATLMRQEADRLEAAGVDSHPVFASRLDLGFCAASREQYVD